MKLFLWLVIGFLAYCGVRAWRRSRVDARARSERPVERMVVCAFCGVNHPLSESVAASGKYYCSEAHCRCGPAKPERCGGT